jgi:septal ring factor EnvC (AmiA/AmiB activator)
MDEREAANRSAADYLARLRQRLADGKSEIQRLRESIDATHEHLAGMSRWIEQTDLQLRDERDRRMSGGDDDE